MFEPQFESALAEHAAPETSYISMREIKTRGTIDLRGQMSDRKFMTEAKNILGLELPKAPRSSITFGDIKALWLSPDQWLILCPRDKAPTLATELQYATSNFHALAVDVSDMRTVIRLEGAGAREVLMKCGSLDFDNVEFSPGYVRRMRFAEIAALFNIVEPEVIDLYVFRSYADYAWNFLLKASRKGSEVGFFKSL